jgi:hypothetical protein
MKLVVRGMAHDSRTQFKHLWGRYILGFKPWTHCLNCFVTHKAKGVLPTMVDGEYPLDDSFELFICVALDGRIVGIPMFILPYVRGLGVWRQQDQFTACNSQSQMRRRS